MNRLTAKLLQGFSRLAFWRKPAEPAADHAETLAPEKTLASEKSSEVPSIKPESRPDADVSVPKPGWFARLKHVWNKRRNSVPDPALNPDEGVEPAPAQAVAAATPQHEPREASVAADAVPEAKPSLLARIKTKFRRHHRIEPDEAVADESKSAAKKKEEASTSRDRDSAEDTAAEDAAPVGGIRRVLAVFSNKWVWISATGGILLAIIGAMTFMLLSSNQEKARLQTELLETQKKLEQPAVVKKPEVIPAAPLRAVEPVAESIGSSDAGSGSVGDAEDCTVTDKASVAQNLKNCIESFNRAMDPSHR